DERDLLAAVGREENQSASHLLETPVLVCDREPVLACEGSPDACPVDPLGEAEGSRRHVRAGEMREKEIARGEAGRARGAGLVGETRAEERELIAEAPPRGRIELARDVPPLHARVVMRAVVAGEREILLRIKCLEAPVRLRAFDARIESEYFCEREEGERRSEGERPGG